MHPARGDLDLLALVHLRLGERLLEIGSGTPDLFVECPERGRGIVQIKSVEGSIFRKKWRDPETNEIAPPLWIAVQGIVEAHLDGAQWAAVAPLVVGFGMITYDRGLCSAATVLARQDAGP